MFRALCSMFYDYHAQTIYPAKPIVLSDLPNQILILRKLCLRKLPVLTREKANIIFEVLKNSLARSGL